MTKEKYDRLLKANNGLAVFACGRQPHDRTWAKYDEPYAYAASDTECDAILMRWKEELLGRLVREGSYIP